MSRSLSRQTIGCALALMLIEISSSIVEVGGKTRKCFFHVSIADELTPGAQHKNAFGNNTPLEGVNQTLKFSLFTVMNVKHNKQKGSYCVLQTPIIITNMILRHIHMRPKSHRESEKTKRMENL